MHPPLELNVHFAYDFATRRSRAACFSIGERKATIGKLFAESSTFFVRAGVGLFRENATSSERRRTLFLENEFGARFRYWRFLAGGSRKIANEFGRKINVLSRAKKNRTVCFLIFWDLFGLMNAFSVVSHVSVDSFEHCMRVLFTHFTRLCFDARRVFFNRDENNWSCAKLYSRDRKTFETEKM